MLLCVPKLTKGAPHVLDGLHLLECHAQHLGGRMHGVDRRRPGRLGRRSRVLTGDPCRLSGFPRALLLLPDRFERVTVLIPDFPRLLGQPPELFRVIPGELRRHALCFGDAWSCSGGFGWIGMFMGQSNVTLSGRER